MMKTKILAFILASIALNAFAWKIQPTNESISGALSPIPAKPSVFTEIHKFFKDEPATHELSDYLNTFVPTMHTLMVNRTHEFMADKINQPKCKSSMTVEFPDNVTQHPNIKSINDFESDFMRVESYTCLGKLDLDKVFETFMSESFQRKAVDGIKNLQVDQESNQTCIKRAIFGLGSLHYCFTETIQNTDTQYIIHSFNEQNHDQVDVTIYFKESMTVLTRLPSGEISLYNLMYARGPEISFHFLVRSSIKTAQEDVKKILIENSH